MNWSYRSSRESSAPTNTLTPNVFRLSDTKEIVRHDQTQDSEENWSFFQLYFLGLHDGFNWRHKEYLSVSPLCQKVY